MSGENILATLAPGQRLSVRAADVVRRVAPLVVFAVLAPAARAASATYHAPAKPARGDLNLNMLLLGSMLALTTCALAFAAAIARRRRLEADLQAGLRQIETAQADTAKAYAYSRLAEELAGIGYWRRDLKGGEIVWSDEMYAIHGLSKAEHAGGIGEEITLYRPEDRRLIRETVGRTIETGQPFDLKVRLNRASDGAERIVAFKGGAERDADGKVGAIFGVTRDITDEETALLRIEESEARYRLLAESSADIVIKAGPDGTIRYISPSIRHYGYDPDALVGTKLTDLAHPDDAKKLNAISRQLFATGKVEAPEERTYRLRKADGGFVWVEGIPTLVLDEAGAPRAVISQVRDISERVAVAEALAESEARYRLLADTSSDVVVSSDPNGVIRYISPSIRRFGYRPDALIGREGADFVHPDDLGHVSSAIGAQILEPDAPARECAYRFRTADGDYVWVESVFSIIRGEGGAITAFVSQVRDISERHAAAEALAESEARYRLLADAASDIVLTNDEAGVINYASPSVRRYGWDPAAMIGLTARDVIHPDDYKKVLLSVVAQINGEAFDPLWDRTYRFRTPGGDYIWMEGVASIVRDENGGLVSVVSQLRDVSERQAAVQALAESEARYRLLADSSTDIVIKVDSEDRIEYISPSVQRYGYDPEAMIGVSGYTLVHPDDLPKLRALIQELFERSEVDPTRDRTYRLRIANGDYVWMEGNPTIIQDAAGQPVAVVSQLRDVSERVAATAALAESEQRHRIIAENATDVVSRTDSRGRFLYLSPSITDVMGYSPGELLGETFVPYMHPEDIKAVHVYYERLREGGTRLGRSLRYRARHKDGRWIWLECNPTILRDADGLPREFIDVTRDITRSVRLEAELMAARDAAEKAAAVKAAFVANMSHEIRTPLTAILGFTNLLVGRPNLDEKERSYVTRIGQAGRALLTIVNDVLDFSKLEAGQFEIRPRTAAPSEVMEEALLMFTPQANAKGLTLAFEPAADLPDRLRLDPDRLRQILLNLIGNAVKFTDAGSVTLIAGYAQEALEVRVKDTGRGMNRAQQRKLFQRFSQVDASPAGRGGGTGLGLAICKGLAEAMGGSISVTSQPGSGSEFCVRIIAPLAGDADVAEDAPPASIEGLRLLLVDDNSANRELARAILLPFGVEVTEAADGLDAVAAAQASPFDAILMDIRMPRLDGPAAAARIRGEEGPNRDAPILAFSADTEFTGEEDGFAFDGVVRKPLSPADLIGGLQRCL